MGVGVAITLADVLIQHIRTLYAPVIAASFHGGGYDKCSPEY